MAEQGKYLTSFLEIFVNTENELDNLALLNPGDLGTYYHEYFHYIQDVTTCSGISKIWNSFDRFRKLIVSIQSRIEPDIFIPLENKIADEQRSHIELLEMLRGAGQISGVSLEVADSYRITEVEYEENPQIKEVFPAYSGAKINLRLASNDRTDKIFAFGEVAISESMAYLVEKKFFPELNKLPRYPYKVAYDLVEHVYPELLSKEENLFALCDVSLMHNLPGWAFVEILNEMKRQKVIPQTGEEVIKFGYQFYQIQQWNFSGYMREADEALQHISSQIFAMPHFEPTMQLFQAFVERGRVLRETCPFAILQIYKSDSALSHNFYKIFNFLGGPHAVNYNGQRVLRSPDGLQNLDEVAHPQHFRVIWQLNKFLLEGLRECSLYHICIAAENKVPVDERCKYAPWKRAEDTYGCPYAAFWAMYGFHLKDFYLNGVPIQEKADF